MLYTMLYTNLCTIQYTNKKTSKREVFWLTNFYKYYRVNPFSVKICGRGIGKLWKFSTELTFFSPSTQFTNFPPLYILYRMLLSLPVLSLFQWTHADHVRICYIQWISLLGNCGFKTQLGCHRDADNKTLCGLSPHDSGSMNHIIITESRNWISSPVYHLGHLLELSWV